MLFVVDAFLAGFHARLTAAFPRRTAPRVRLRSRRGRAVGGRRRHTSVFAATLVRVGLEVRRRIYDNRRMEQGSNLEALRWIKRIERNWT